MFFNVLTQVLILFILISLGVILEKSNFLTDIAVKNMTDVVLYFVTPCVIIKSFIREFDRSVLKNLLISLLIAVLVHIGSILLTRLLIHDKDKAREAVLQTGTIFSNCGFMSLPLQQALLGDEGVLYGSVFIAVFNIFIWSYGIVLMSGDKKYLTPKKLVINPGIIGIAVGLVIFLLSIPVPKIIAEPINYMAALNTPIPMIIIGYHLAKSNILNGIKNIKCLFAVFIKLAAIPLISLGIMYACGIRGTMLVSSIICCCAPTAATTTMFASKFSKDTELSVSMVSLSTLLSLISMPLLITFAQTLA